MPEPIELQYKLHLMMQKQAGNGVKGKEAKVAKERRPGSQPRKSGVRQSNSKGYTKFTEIYQHSYSCRLSYHLGRCCHHNSLQGSCTLVLALCSLL